MENFIILREKYSSRGGGIEIDLSNLGYPDEKMTAYQNYLGGGMAGGIGTDCTIEDWKGHHQLTKIAEELIKLFAYNMGYQEENIKDFNSLPLSAY
tara:strand:- start:422 stop:709 length:288 start_codon:yes stop_codon:yes gene_type:complete